MVGQNGEMILTEIDHVAIGRDPSAIERSIGVSPGKVELADAYRAAGATEFTIGMSGPSYDFAPVRDWLAWRDGVNAS